VARRGRKGHDQDNERDDKVTLEGIVEEALPAAQFRVRVSEHLVIATLSGRMRQNRIRVLVADRVEIEFSPYDLTRGRITRRL
jgi:translation initiation factor IF-1